MIVIQQRFAAETTEMLRAVCARAVAVVPASAEVAEPPLTLAAAATETVIVVLTIVVVDGIGVCFVSL